MQRVEVVRHSCRQQLSNAIKQIAIDHSDFFDDQIEAEADRYKNAIKELEEQ